MRQPDTPQAGGNALDEPRWHLYACLALLLVALYLVAGQRLRLSAWHVEAQTNSALEEAIQWKRGSLSLESNTYEVAEENGRRYNVVGLAFVLVSLLGTTLTSLGGGSADAFHGPYYLLLVGIPLPLAAFGSFRSAACSSRWGAVLAGQLIVGTSLLPVLEECQGRSQGGSVYFINHVLAVTGLLIFGADLLGRRRVWPAVLGLALAAWSRQMTLLYVLPLCLLARGSRKGQPRQGLSRSFKIALVGAAFIAAVPMTLNTLKFGNPIDTGYSRIYQGRTDPIGSRGRESLFGLRYVPTHAWAMNCALPGLDVRGGSLYLDCAGVNGASIWLTSPILLAAVVTAPRWWRDGRRRALMLGTLPVIAGLWCYHTTAADGAGHYRYALDFIPIWLLVIAPYVTGRRAASLALGSLAFSALYFSLIP